MADVSQETIDRVVETIVSDFAPERVLLFGSRARGDHRPDSDIDLFVEMDTELPKRNRAARIRSVFDPYPCAMDIIVYTPAETAYWQEAAASLVSTVLREGKLVYERTGSGTREGVVRES